MRRTATLITGVLGLGLLAACSSAPDFSVFGADQAKADRIPSATSRAVPEVDPGSTRLLGDFGGYTFYAAYADRRDEPPSYLSMVCLVAVPDGLPHHAASSCSAGVSAELGMGLPGVELMLVPDTFDTSVLIDDGWTRVHQNLLAL